MAKQAAPPQGTGRATMNVRENILWTQRVQAEDKVFGKGAGQFSIRASVSVEGVPSKFKPGHYNPSAPIYKSTQGFDPAKHGWDPDGDDAREFRRSIAMQVSGPQHKYPYPVTSYQEVGWLLMPGGDPADRTRQKKNRYGLGWECKPPAEWSESAVEPPLARTSKQFLASSATTLAIAEGSAVSAMPPSTLSALAPSQLAELRAGNGITTFPRATSQVSATAPVVPSALSGSQRSGEPGTLMGAAGPSSNVSAAPSSAIMSRASSLPVLAAPVDRLRRRDAKLVQKWKESYEFHNKGLRGNRWFKPLGETDATAFANAFAKATGGVPLHKWGKPQNDA